MRRWLTIKRSKARRSIFLSGSPANPRSLLLKPARPSDCRTQWLLLTSGTTGVPKLVMHDVAGLTAAVTSPKRCGRRRGMGHLLRHPPLRRFANVSSRRARRRFAGTFSSAGEPIADHLDRLAQHGVTQLSGTPSQWRSALINPTIRKIAPRYVRLSGEIADQAILDRLRATFPQAAVGHAYASTEAGVAFDVNDGLAGFPASYIGPIRDGVEMKVFSDGSLRIRSPRAASRYVGAEQARRRRWICRYR